LEKEEAFGSKDQRNNGCYMETIILVSFIELPMKEQGRGPFVSLKDGSNDIKGTPALLEHATDFYKKLFGPVIDTRVRLNDNV
jgi:hypothetical protein